MAELIFVVEEAPEGGYTARALGEAIFTESENLVDLHEKIRDAVRCHFDEGTEPKILRLHFVREGQGSHRSLLIGMGSRRTTEIGAGTSNGAHR